MCLRRLNVPIDDLLVPHDETDLDEGGYIPPSRTENLQNCISVYRHTKSLTFRVLGNRLGGISRERARSICASNTPTEKHIQKLAAYEGVSPEVFRTLYAPQMEEAV